MTREGGTDAETDAAGGGGFRFGDRRHLTACGGNDDPVEDPLFAAEVTGAVTRTAAGVSAFGVVRDGGQTGFTFVMEDETGTTILAPETHHRQAIIGSI